MEERKRYRFRVSHPAHGETEVVAGDRYGAVVEAAREWGLRWTTIGADCKVKLLGEARQIRKGAKANAKNHQKGNRTP